MKLSNGQKFKNAAVEILEFASKRFDKLEKVIRDTWISPLYETRA